jgi:hypothetical protein
MGGWRFLFTAAIVASPVSLLNGFFQPLMRHFRAFLVHG